MTDIKNSDVLLALYSFYVNATDQELKDIGVAREAVLTLIRHFEPPESPSHHALAVNLLLAFAAGAVEGG